MRKLFFILIFLSSKAIAQSNKLAFKNTFEVEVDPIAFMLNGYSFHAIYNHNQIRYDAGFFGIERPERLSGNKGFKVYTTGFGIKANYMLKKVNGAYVGIDLGYIKNNITVKETKEKDISRSTALGTHLGYRFFLFPKRTTALSGLYLTPWAGISYNYNYEKATIAGYKEKSFDWFATFHIGYRF